MKKYIQIISCFLFSGILFSGCSDFLDRQPLDKLSTDVFYKNEQEIQQGLASTYLRFRADAIGGMGNGNGSSMDLEALTDNAYSTSGFQSLQNIARGTHAASVGAIDNMWQNGWQGVAYCNFFLDNLEKAEVKALISEENYKKYKGEALFNRCYFYNLLVQHFGDIPLITTSVTPDMPYLGYARDPKSKVVEQILQDIDIAIDGLPLTGYTDGHAVKGSAIMLKMRILMNNHKYAEAITTAEMLIKNSGNPHKITDDYAGMFFDNQKNNPEIMFSVQYSTPDDAHQFDQYTGSRMSCYPLGDLALAFGKKADGTDDPRKRMTLIMVGDPWVMHTRNTSIATGTYTYPNGLGTFEYTLGQFPPRQNPVIPVDAESNIPAWSMAWKKGVNPTLNQPRDKISGQHRVMMRYADLLLLYAEAKVEAAGGSTTDADALKAFNEVRTRPGVDMPEETTLTREIVRNERRVELAYEGVRLYDILRWDIGAEVTANKVISAGGNGVSNVSCKWISNLWPIPQNVMNIMVEDAKWEQNAPY